MQYPSKRPFWTKVDQLTTQFINLVLPPTCASCGQVGLLICDACRVQLEPIGKATCGQCGKRMPQNSPTHFCRSCKKRPFPLQAIRAAFHYRPPLTQIIHRLKYNHAFALAQPLAQLMSNEWAKWQTPIDLIMPVPLHPARKKKRGYNQSELLAQAFGLLLNIPIDTKRLVRQRNTRPQVELSAAERTLNMQNAFAVPKQLSPVRILLIDDVATTGATLSAAAAALRANGATAVSAFCLARALPGQHKS